MPDALFQTPGQSILMAILVALAEPNAEPALATLGVLLLVYALDLLLLHLRQSIHSHRLCLTHRTSVGL